MNPEQFVAVLREQGIELNEKQIEQFSLYFQTLLEWNKKMNLTGLTAENDVYLKHFFDSISAAFYMDFTKRVTICDVGGGAGFPSIPLKICFPDIKVTIVDSLKKRINFLTHLADILSLTDVVFCHDRAENFGKEATYRGKFDIVIARAVAKLSVLSELCLPLCKQDGIFVAMKGTGSSEELSDAEKAIKLLGGETKEVHQFKLPEEKSERSIIMVDKVRKTPSKYPRKAGVPNKQPLI